MQQAGVGQVAKIVAVHSAKGGVGKSTVTTNLAVALARAGMRVGLLDADVHGPSTAIMLGNAEWPDPGTLENTIQPIHAHGVRFISMGNLTESKTPTIWRGAMVHNMLNQFLHNVIWGPLDLLLLDMPPGTGDALLSISQEVALAGTIMVSTPQELAMVDSMRGLRAFEQMQIPVLGMIENMSAFVCPCGHVAHPFAEGGVEILAEELTYPLLAKIPLDPQICSDADEGRPFVLEPQESPAARAYQSAVRRLIAQLEMLEPGAGFELEWRPMNWDERYPEAPARPENLLTGLPWFWQVSEDELGICYEDAQAIISVRALRLACPCAACVDEWTGEPKLDPVKVPSDLKLKTLRTVGRYALLPEFSDGHRSGIFTHQKIKALAEKGN